MDKESPRWMWFLLGRIVSYALLGGLSAALCGAILISLSGAVVGWVIDFTTPNGAYVIGNMANYGRAIGAVFGGISGGGAGLVIWSVIGFLSAPRRSFLPPRSILSKIVLGMSTVTLAAMTSFFLVSYLLSYLRKVSFHRSVDDGLTIILFGGPALMVCGAIAGAILGFRRETAQIANR